MVAEGGDGGGEGRGRDCGSHLRRSKGVRLVTALDCDWGESLERYWRLEKRPPWTTGRLREGLRWPWKKLGLSGFSGRFGGFGNFIAIFFLPALPTSLGTLELMC